MVIYLDSNYVCHLTNDGTMRAFETTAFDGMGEVCIVNSRFVPEGETWERSDGVVFQGQMISPVIPSSKMELAQTQYNISKAQMSDMQTALEILGVTE